VLPKNPWLTDHLISRALLHHYQDVATLGSLAPLEDQAEAEAHAAALRLACRTDGRWRAAMAFRSRRRATPQPAWQLTGRYATPRPADEEKEKEKEIAWTSR
jgi:hypothetical protein